MSAKPTSPHGLPTDATEQNGEHGQQALLSNASLPTLLVVLGVVGVVVVDVVVVLSVAGGAVGGGMEQGRGRGEVGGRVDFVGAWHSLVVVWRSVEGVGVLAVVVVLVIWECPRGVLLVEYGLLWKVQDSILRCGC